MSQSDFVIRRGPSDANLGIHTGSAVLNSLLSNPLTSSVNCRAYNEINLSTGQTISGLFFLSSSVSGGQFINIAETKSVSLRAWCRTNSYNDGSGRGFSLLAKHNGFNTAFGNSPVRPNDATSGYEFGFDGLPFDGSTFNGRLYYRFGNYKNNNTAKQVLLSPLNKQNVWLGLRMDIVPVRANTIVGGVPVSSTLKDVVTLYTASISNPDNWGQISSYELPVDGDDFVPWGSYTLVGSAPGAGSTVTSSSYGFSSYMNVGTNQRVYFDDFQIFVRDAF